MQNNSGTHGHQWLNAGASSQVFDGSKAQQKNAVEGGGVILMTTPLHRNECFIKKSLNSQISYHTSLPRYIAFGNFT